MDLVRLGTRQNPKGKRIFILDYVDSEGKRKRESLGHSDKRKAERQRVEKELNLQRGIIDPQKIRLTAFLKDSLERTTGQVKNSTLTQHDIAMRHFIDIVGNINLADVRYKHGEQFIQHRLDEVPSPATVNKEIRSIKRLFNLAVKRGQIEMNPFQHLAKPKCPRQKINVYTPSQCQQIIKAAGHLGAQLKIDWQNLITVALCTGMRRGELLNLVWSDVDFEQQSIGVSPKRDTEFTWTWAIKDCERRTLPLTEDVTKLLTRIQAEQPDGHPYIFVPPWRYERIQKLRRLDKWPERDAKCPLNGFTRHWQQLLAHAGIKSGEFHDLRRTCLTEWLANGLSEYDVMTLAGHSDFQTTHRFYLSVRRDLIDRAREASRASMPSNLGTILARAPFSSDIKEQAVKPKSLTVNNLPQYPREDSNL